MIVICEDCGKKYRIDPSKIVKETVKFKCKVCSHIVEVSKPVSEPLRPESTPQPSSGSPAGQSPAAAEHKPSKQPAIKLIPRKASEPGRWRVGLRLRMFILFFLVPIAFFVAAGLLYLNEMKNLTTMLTGQSIEIVTRMAENSITQKARAVAAQCKLYLLTHPDLQPQEFNRDPNFKRLAVQRIGMRGYTALYALPGADRKWQTWNHVDEKIIGVDMAGLQKPMGKYFSAFWNIYTGVRDGSEASGYYTWKDKDGAFREKFMVCTPIEGTPYVIAATAYVNELIAPIKTLESRSEHYNQLTRTSVLAILVGTVVLIGLIVSLFGHRLAGRIKSLTEVAERISVGDLDADIPIR
jgi:signal transduction histidine kinase